MREGSPVPLLLLLLPPGPHLGSEELVESVLLPSLTGTKHRGELACMAVLLSPSAGGVPVPGPIVGRRAVESLHGRQQALTRRHGGWEADVFGVQRFVVGVLQLSGAQQWISQNSLCLSETKTVSFVAGDTSTLDSTADRNLGFVFDSCFKFD